jgi:N-acetylmuramoyl-L-alanine amidase
LFLGEAVTSYSVELQKGNPSKLVFHFSAPVNPMVSTEPGRVRLNFTRDPVVAGANPQNLDDPAIHSATFSEGNGSAEISVVTSEPLLATFSENNRTITLAPPPPPVAQASKPTPPGPVPIPPSTAIPPAAPGPAAPAPPRFTIIIDPAHGGDDTGAALAEGLFEKEVTLAVARRLRADLEQRGMVAVLLRDSDVPLTLDQRATATNASRGDIYISIHAAALGSGVRIYSARLGDTPPINKHGFLPWNSAQAAYLDQSHNLAASVIAELESRKVQGTPLESGLRPLRNVAKPAIAIEIAPPPGAIEALTSAGYQQSIASGLAAGVANVRNTMETTR